MDSKRLLIAAIADSGSRCLLYNYCILLMIIFWTQHSRDLEDAAAPVNINNFLLTHQLHCESPTGRAVVYKRNGFSFTTVLVQMHRYTINLSDESKFGLAPNSLCA